MSRSLHLDNSWSLETWGTHPAHERGGEALSSRETRHLACGVCTSHPKHENVQTYDFMTTCPGDPRSILNMSKDYKKTQQDHGIPKQLISRITILIKINPDVHQHLKIWWNISCVVPCAVGFRSSNQQIRNLRRESSSCTSRIVCFDKMLSI